MQGPSKKVYDFFHGYIFPEVYILIHEVKRMQEKENERERKPIPWEVADPKPPVIQSGHLENRVRNFSEE